MREMSRQTVRLRIIGVCEIMERISLRELSQQPHMLHLSDSVVDEYAEEAE